VYFLPKYFRSLFSLRVFVLAMIKPRKLKHALLKTTPYAIRLWRSARAQIYFL